MLFQIQEIAARLDGYRVTAVTLRAQLATAEAERNTAEEMLRGCRVRCERMRSMEGMPLDECAARQLHAEQERDAARGTAAGLREALEEGKRLSKDALDSLWDGNNRFTDAEDALFEWSKQGLSTPGKSISEWQAEVWQKAAEHCEESDLPMPIPSVGVTLRQHGANVCCAMAAELRDEAARLRAGGGE